MPGSGPRRPNRSIMKAVADAFRQDPAYLRALEQARAEKAEKSKPKAKRSKSR